MVHEDAVDAPTATVDALADAAVASEVSYFDEELAVVVVDVTTEHWPMVWIIPTQ